MNRPASIPQHIRDNLSDEARAGIGAVVEALENRIAELVARLNQNSTNSSKPPSTDKKAKREGSRPGGAKPGHQAHNRPLAKNPDEFRDYRPEVCEQCGGRFAPDADEDLIGDARKEAQHLVEADPALAGQPGLATAVRVLLEREQAEYLEKA